MEEDKKLSGFDRYEIQDYFFYRPVFPVWGNQKTPVSPHGFKDAHCFYNILEMKSCGDHVGDALPQDKKVVGDVDENEEKGYHGLKYLKELEEKLGPLPRTLTQRTPHGGLHYIFEKEGVIDNPAAQLATNIDFKVNGYILIYPSSIDGREYRIIDKGSDSGFYTAKLPQKWLDWANRKDTSSTCIKTNYKPIKRVYKNIDINKMFEGCKFLQYCRDNADILSEPMWFSMVSVLAHIADSDELIHELSQPYPKYRYRETQKKIENARKFGCPQSCAYISASYPDVCQGCNDLE